MGTFHRWGQRRHHVRRGIQGVRVKFGFEIEADAFTNNIPRYLRRSIFFLLKKKKCLHNGRRTLLGRTPTSSVSGGPRQTVLYTLLVNTQPIRLTTAGAFRRPFRPVGGFNRSHRQNCPSAVELLTDSEIGQGPTVSLPKKMLTVSQ